MCISDIDPLPAYLHTPIPTSHAGPIVVTVPPLPRHFSAPPSAYSTPPPDGLVVGTVVAFAIPITSTPEPYDDIFPFNPTLPLVSQRERNALLEIKSSG